MRREAHLEEHFATPEHQASTARLGMWIFLATEVLFFTSLFVAYVVYRSVYAEQFKEAGHHMAVALGTINTYVLITSSLFVALAHHFSKQGRSGLVAVLTLLAALLGIAFMVIKGIEYTRHFHEGLLPGGWWAFPGLTHPGAAMFVTLYWLTTGVHTVHVAIGVAVLAWLSFEAASGKYSSAYHSPVEMGGLYWHFVDAVWVFLYPMFYLV
ncbi:MAG: cytochrome c oxidase subunit 3 [Myxococcaceae bacterium]